MKNREATNRIKTAIGELLKTRSIPTNRKETKEFATEILKMTNSHENGNLRPLVLRILRQSISLRQSRKSRNVYDDIDEIARFQKEFINWLKSIRKKFRQLRKNNTEELYEKHKALQVRHNRLAKLYGTLQKQYRSLKNAWEETQAEQEAPEEI